VNQNIGWCVGSEAYTGGVIFKTTTGGNVVGIIYNNNKFPTEYKLIQNFPNPFNSQTTIGYYNPAKSFIKITLVNVLGEEVLKIFEGYTSAGYHNILLSANELSSGVYFYKILAGNTSAGIFTDTKKLIIIK
jgi:hypothetical protein